MFISLEQWGLFLLTEMPEAAEDGLRDPVGSEAPAHRYLY